MKTLNNKSNKSIDKKMRAHQMFILTLKSLVYYFVNQVIISQFLILFLFHIFYNICTVKRDLLESSAFIVGCTVIF